jgi:hypothetical protein
MLQSHLRFILHGWTRAVGPDHRLSAEDQDTRPCLVFGLVVVSSGGILMRSWLSDQGEVAMAEQAQGKRPIFSVGNKHRLAVARHRTSMATPEGATTGTSRTSMASKLSSCMTTRLRPAPCGWATGGGKSRARLLRGLHVVFSWTRLRRFGCGRAGWQPLQGYSCQHRHIGNTVSNTHETRYNQFRYA